MDHLTLRCLADQLITCRFEQLHSFFHGHGESARDIARGSPQQN
jgi:hypothetical protein